MPVGFWIVVAGCVSWVLGILVHHLSRDFDCSTPLVIIGLATIPIGLLVWYLFP